MNHSRYSLILSTISILNLLKSEESSYKIIYPNKCLYNLCHQITYIQPRQARETICTYLTEFDLFKQMNLIIALPEYFSRPLIKTKINYVIMYQLFFIILQFVHQLY